MPTSNLYLAGEIVALVDQCQPHETVLDVGPGWGKYATLLREYLNVRPLRIDAIELHEPYVEAHRLRALYDHVGVGDVCAMPQELLGRYDVVLMVDVIEHMELDAGMRLCDRIPGAVVICTPVEWFSNGPGLPASETHRSHWTQVQWDQLGQVRPVEACYQSHGGWLVRLGRR